jgi:hypothetical protein
MPAATCVLPPSSWRCGLLGQPEGMHSLHPPGPLAARSPDRPKLSNPIFEFDQENCSKLRPPGPLLASCPDRQVFQISRLQNLQVLIILCSNNHTHLVLFQPGSLLKPFKEHPPIFIQPGRGDGLVPAQVEMVIGAESVINVESMMSQLLFQDIAHVSAQALPGRTYMYSTQWVNRSSNVPMVLNGSSGSYRPQPGGKECIGTWTQPESSQSLSETRVYQRVYQLPGFTSYPAKYWCLAVRTQSVDGPDSYRLATTDPTGLPVSTAHR